nr:MAG TPA: hypothetical protein [Caudoviricetes sp.]
MFIKINSKPPSKLYNQFCLAKRPIYPKTFLTFSYGL